MEEFKVIELHRSRDFGRKINATFEFVRQNFKSLGKSLLFIAAPAVVIGSLMIGSFMGDFTGNILSQAGNPDAFNKFVLSWSFWVQFILMFIFLIVSMIMSVSTINNYMLLYSKKRTNEISVQEVWEKVRGSLASYLGSSFLFFVLFVGAYILVILIGMVFGAASSTLGGIGVFVGVCAMFYLWISSSLTLFIQTYEDKNFFSALARSVKLVQGKWWSTFGLLFILTFIMYAVSYLLVLPFSLVMGVTMMHKVTSPVTPEIGATKFMTVAIVTFFYIIYLLLSSLPNVGVAFQYFNLVELKEAKGLMSDIENVGKPEEPGRPEETY